MRTVAALLISIRIIVDPITIEHTVVDPLTSGHMARALFINILIQAVQPTGDRTIAALPAGTRINVTLPTSIHSTVTLNSFTTTTKKWPTPHSGTACGMHPMIQTPR